MRRDSDDDFVELDEPDEEGEFDPGSDDFDDGANDGRGFFDERKNIFFVVTGVLVVFVVVIMFFLSRGDVPVSKEDFTALFLRVDRIESRVNQLDGLERAVAELIETQRNVPDQTDLVRRLDALSRKVDVLQKNMNALSGEATKRQVTESGMSTPRYHTVRRGETLYGIARAYNIGLERLLVANDINRNDPLQVGQRLIIPSE